MIQSGLDVVNVSAFDLVPVPDASPHLRDGDVRTVRRTDQKGIGQLGGAGCEDVLDGQLGHGRQVHPLPEGVHLQEDPHGELRILGAVFQDLLAVVLPLGVHVAGIDIQLGLPEQLHGHGVEGLLLGMDLLPGGPPCIADDPAFDAPEPLAAELRLPSVPPPGHGILHPVDLRPLLDLADVVVVDVVSGDDVGVLLPDQVGESVDDVLLGAVDGLALPHLPLVPHGCADAQEEIVIDAVLYVEGEDPQSGVEGVDVLERGHLQRDVRQVSLVDRLPGYADARPHVDVVDVAMVVRDVRCEGVAASAFQSVAVVGDLPRALDADLQGIDVASSVQEHPVLHGQYLGILLELVL